MAERAGRAPALPRRLTGNSPKGAQLRAILEGLVAALPPGTALPSERELAERYGVARMTVRGEIDRLTTDGLTYRLQGRGTFVSEPRVAQAMTLSSFTEDMRARDLSPSSRVLATEATEAGAYLAGRLELAPHAPVLRVERLRLADGDPLAVEQAYLPLERFPQAAEADFAAASLFDLLSGWDASPADADQRVLAVACDETEAGLLGVAPGHPGLRFMTLARDGGGVPVYYAVSLFRGDKYEIDLRQTR